MKICVAGQGAFGQKHLDALKRIPGVEVTSLVGGNQDSTAAVAKKYGIPHYTGELSEGIKRADAVILTTPTKMHFRQGEQVMAYGEFHLAHDREVVLHQQVVIAVDAAADGVLDRQDPVRGPPAGDRREHVVEGFAGDEVCVVAEMEGRGLAVGAGLSLVGNAHGYGRSSLAERPRASLGASLPAAADAIGSDYLTTIGFDCSNEISISYTARA